jgi:uncharacterized protein YoxC
MGPGGIATIIAAVSLFVIAVAIAYAVIRVGRLVDEVQKTVRSVNRITTSAENATEKINLAITNLVDKNANLLKLVVGAFTAMSGRKRSSKDHE